MAASWGRRVTDRASVPQHRMAAPSVVKRAMTLANTPRIHTYFLYLILKFNVNSPSPAR